MNCELVARLLPNYLDEELTEELAQEAQTHLIRCPRCAWEVESIRQTLVALGRFSAAVEPEARFRERLLGSLLRDHRAAAAERPWQAASGRPIGSDSAFVLDLDAEETSDA